MASHVSSSFGVNRYSTWTLTSKDIFVNGLTLLLRPLRLNGVKLPFPFGSLALVLEFCFSWTVILTCHVVADEVQVTIIDTDAVTGEDTAQFADNILTASLDAVHP